MPCFFPSKRTQKFGTLPDEGVVDAKTPGRTKAKRVADSSKALESFYQSPIKKDSHRPAQKKLWTSISLESNSQQAKQIKGLNLFT